jgi:ASC-1-like (ASCH) protein
MLGLIGKNVKGKRTYISAVHPRRLVQLANFRQKEVERAYPELLGLYEGSGNKPKVYMLEGNQAVRDTYTEIFKLMEQGNELLVFSHTESVSEHMSDVLEEYLRTLGRMNKPKAREFIFDNEVGRNWAKRVNDFWKDDEHTRLASPDLDFGLSESLIIGDKIFFFSAGENIFVVTIEYAGIVKTQRALFEMAWKSGKKLEKSHILHLDPEPYQKILSGEKDLELRVNDTKRQGFTLGDTIHFINRETGESLTKIISSLVHRKKFSDLFTEDVSLARAGFTENTSIDDELLKYYSKEEVKKFGVVGIFLE